MYRESYTRAYKLVVRVQQLSELEEIIEYKQLKDNPERQNMIRYEDEKRGEGIEI